MHHISKGKSARAATRMVPEEDPEFQIAPMIDILLVLLVFFMSITSTEVLQTNDEVRLPVAKDGKDPSKDADSQVIVNVIWSTMTNSGTFDLGSQRFSQAADLLPVLTTKVGQNPDMRVLVRADKEVRYEFLKTLLQTIGNAHVSKVTFSVVDKETATTAALTL
jgi:biopolymer transport protein ExbD